MDDRARQVLKQLLAQYGTTLCDQPGRCRGLLLDVLQGACAAEVNTLLLTLQYGIVQDLRAVVGTRPPVLLLPHLVQKLRARVPIDETATRWAIEAWAAALGLYHPAPLSSPSPPVMSSPPLLSAPLPTWRNSIGMEFVLIQPGEFSMGSSASEADDDDERPVHTVRLTNAFYLGKYEVTHGQWQQVMGNNPSDFKSHRNLPVERVSWNDVQTFITTLNAKEGQQFYRLPTEAEWEYAARAGTSTAYSFGNDPRQLGKYAWYQENSEGTTHPVGQKEPNTWGLHDMHGNVCERVQDWYRAYTAATAVDPAGPSSSIGSDRVDRGGSWNDGAGRWRVSYRGSLAPRGRRAYLGFRLLRTVG